MLAGIPCIFCDHYFTWGDQLRNTIKELRALRERHGIRADSKLEILCAEADMYVGKIDGRCVQHERSQSKMGKMA